MHALVDELLLLGKRYFFCFDYSYNEYVVSFLKSFPLPFGAWDRLCYSIVQPPGHSITSYFAFVPQYYFVLFFLKFAFQIALVQDPLFLKT